MTKIGNRPSQMMVFNKTAAKNKVPKVAVKGVLNKKTNNNNKMRTSMQAYKTFATTFAKTGLHDPKASNYHNELVKNMKNYQMTHPQHIPMHNKEWFVNQLKRNVWALKNNTKIVSPVKNVTRQPARINTTVTKTRRLIDARKGAKPKPKPKTMTDKQLKDHLKAITMRLRATNK